jgi:hypothetical protein
MGGTRNRFMWAALIYWGALSWASGDVLAQATSAAGASAASTAASGYGMGMGMGMGMMPMMYAMNPSASLSPTDAAALGMQGQANGSIGANGMNSVFRNPAAAPYLFGSVYPMSPAQMGSMMLLNQAGLTGIGSGQLSGVRPGAATARSRAGKAPAPKPRGSASTPGGLAAHYFNRTAPVFRHPQSYYQRQTRYFPQSAQSAH